MLSMSYPSAVTTERLDLRPVDPVTDLDALGHLESARRLDTRHQGRGYATELGAPRLAYADRELDDELLPLLRA
jgi:RimJ/RimL family protein N-acetyltransferase